MVYTVNYPGVGALKVVDGSDVAGFACKNNGYDNLINLNTFTNCYCCFGCSPGSSSGLDVNIVCFGKSSESVVSFHANSTGYSPSWLGTYDLKQSQKPSGWSTPVTSTTPEGVSIISSRSANFGPFGTITNLVLTNTNDFVDVRDLNIEVLADLIFNYEPPEPADDDPYSGAGDSTPGGGGGDFDDTSTDVDFPPLPNISVADAGFLTIFTPTLAQMQSLGNYMWTGAFDPTNFKKIVANPLDVFIGLSILPISVPSSTSKNIILGGIDTGIVMNVANQQFIDVDFGTLTIKTGTGDSYLDYSPYTKASIFLPYIGWRDLDIDEIMKKTLHLKYRVDIVTGGCVAFLKCGGSVLYEWSGQCSINIPLTSIDWSSTYSAVISAVGHITGTVAGVATSAGSGNPLGIAGSVIEGASALAGDVMSAKPQYPKSGSLGGPSGVIGHQQAYICLTRPRLQKPRYQSKYMGYPSFVTKKISDLVGTGFNAFSDIKLQGIGLLDSELSELESILKGGVYL